MRKITLQPKDKKNVSISLKKIIGQLQSISEIVENDKITDQTFTQLLAAKGGVSRVCKDIIAKGVLNNLDKYSPEELEGALEVIFRLD
jgi:DNA-binding FrmR family transcriptional regulator